MSVASGATIITDTSLGDYAPDTRRLVISGEGFREYSWLLDITHDHTAGLFKHSRLSQLVPYILARVADAAAAGADDSGYLQ